MNLTVCQKSPLVVGSPNAYQSDTCYSLCYWQKYTVNRGLVKCGYISCAGSYSWDFFSVNLYCAQNYYVNVNAHIEKNIDTEKYKVLKTIQAHTMF